MRAIRAGLDIRNLNNENINFIPLLTEFKPVIDAVNAHLVEIAREHKISSSKQKPAMIPQDVKILYEEKQLVLLSSNKFNPQ